MVYKREGDKTGIDEFCHGDNFDPTNGHVLHCHSRINSLCHNEGTKVQNPWRLCRVIYIAYYS